MAENTLYYGDNLDILRRYINAETVDLVYLDPPFNSNATYNVLFAEQNGSRAAAQIKAFGDTWRWDAAAARTYQETVQAGGKVSEALQAFHLLVGESNMLAYLAMMAPRLVELRRVLRPTGSIYLHCDPTASHYLKLLMDAVFGPENFRSEVIWKRTSAHSSAKRYGPVHDVLLFYSRSEGFVWNQQYEPYDQAYLDSHYRATDAAGRAYTLSDLTAAGTRNGSSGQPWRGFDPASKGNHWKFTRERLDELDVAGRIYWPASGGWPRYRRYLDEVKGVPLQDIWSDIDPVNAQAADRLGYPTQKPVRLLERIVSASSNPGDSVLDPFCGCGTTISAAQRTGRHWFGIDITHLAINLIKHRLATSYPQGVSYRVIGEPVSLPDAQDLAGQDPYQFQYWALGLVGARPVEQKKGGDKGIDGKLFFHDEADATKTKQVVFSVKAGHLLPTYVRDLRGVLDREQAQIGVLITMGQPTRQMRSEAASAGFYHSPGWNTDYPRLQILTVAELLAGTRIEMPPLGQVSVTFKKAPKVHAVQAGTLPLPLGGS